jgi:hypothetical protein
MWDQIPVWNSSVGIVQFLSLPSAMLVLCCQCVLVYVSLDSQMFSSGLVCQIKVISSH